MARTIIPVPRRLVTPQGGWWTGAGSMFFDGIDDLVAGVFPAALAVANGPVTIVQTTMATAGNYSLGVAVGKIAIRKLLWVGSGTAAPFKYAAGLYGPVITSTDTVFPGKFIRQVATFNPTGGVFSLYVDAELKAFGALETWDLTTGDTMVIGGIAGYKSRSWKHDVRIYSRVWSPAEITDDSRGEWVDPTGLVRHWPLEAKVGATTHERIGNTYDAVTGAVIDANVVPWRARTVSPARTASPARSAA